MTRKNDTFSSCVALDDVTVFEAAELDAIALLADTWDDDLDLEVSVQLVRPSHLSPEDRRRRLKELKEKTECRACGRKGHWANDREARLRRTKYVQLAWRHDNIFATKRTRLERVLFSTTTVTIPIHPHRWLEETFFYRQN